MNGRVNCNIVPQLRHNSIPISKCKSRIDLIGIKKSKSETDFHVRYVIKKIIFFFDIWISHFFRYSTFNYIFDHIHSPPLPSSSSFFLLPFYPFLSLYLFPSSLTFDLLLLTSVIRLYLIFLLWLLLLLSLMTTQEFNDSDAEWKSTCFSWRL